MIDSSHLINVADRIEADLRDNILPLRIERHLIDRAQGEWFRGVTRDGRVLDSFAKVGFWKCPYHNGRMGLEAVRRLRALPGRVAPRLSS